MTWFAEKVEIVQCVRCHNVVYAGLSSGASFIVDIAPVGPLQEIQAALDRRRTFEFRAAKTPDMMRMRERPPGLAGTGATVTAHTIHVQHGCPGSPPVQELPVVVEQPDPDQLPMYPPGWEEETPPFDAAAAIAEELGGKIISAREWRHTGYAPCHQCGRDVLPGSGVTVFIEGDDPWGLHDVCRLPRQPRVPTVAVWDHEGKRWRWREAENIIDDLGIWDAP